jgi:hypothetical protein
MPAEYDRTIPVNGAALRVHVEDGLVRAYHNGREVASRRGDLGTLMFQVTEEGQPVVYDIAVLQSGYVRIFVGRNGLLIYSDDPLIQPKKTIKE